MSDADGVLNYRYEADREDWRTWKREVPRSQSLRERLDELRALDRRFDLRAVVAERHAADVPTRLDADAIERVLSDPPPETDDTRLALVRIRRRTMSALPSAREQGCDRAADELHEIQSICDELLGF